MLRYSLCTIHLIYGHGGKKIAKTNNQTYVYKHYLAKIHLKIKKQNETKNPPGGNGSDSIMLQD